VRTSSLVLAVLLLASCRAEPPRPPPPAAPAAEADPSWSRARPGFAWEFPRDHAAHRGYRIEWWYLTGLVRAREAPERTFGYQFTVFRVGLRRERAALSSAFTTDTLLLGHAAITDVAGGEHRFADLLRREVPLLAGFGAPGEPLLAWARAPAGTDGRWAIAWNGEGFDVEMIDARQGMAYRLTTRPDKPLCLHGDRGFSAKSADGESASHYYSFPRLRTRGTLTLDGRTFAVEGTSWMDKEFSSASLSPRQVGWDWFALRLVDGRDLMLYVLRGDGGATDFAQGSLISAAGEVRSLPGSAFRLAATARWGAYPSRWTLELPEEKIAVTVEPLVADQENRGTVAGAPRYWEGAVRVLDARGDEVGEGYVELTGYGEGSRPPV
jgi:predicted secreted hydrolase